MSTSFARTVQVLMATLLVVFIASLTVEAQTQPKDGKKSGDKDKNDPPGTGKYLNQLRTVFAAWDTNSDNTVDRDELARAYRGPTAKALDPERDFLKLDQFADYHVFKLLDGNGDWVLTRAEFDTWARGQAALLAEQENALERITQKQKQLAKANPKGKNYDKMKNDLKREREQADRLQDRIRAMQKQIQQLKRDDDKGKNDKKKGM